MRSPKKIVAHQIVLLGVLVVLTAMRLLTGRWNFGLGVLWWWLGALVGFLFVFLDRLVYAFWQKPEETLSLRMRELFGQGLFVKGLVAVLQEREDQIHLTMRSVLFLAVWVVMGIFTVTSVGAAFGRGFMLGLGVHLSIDLVSDYLGRGRDIRLWFWQIKREITEVEVKGVVWGYLILFVLIALGL